jgi:hypothetical protein
VLFSFAH